MKKIILIALLVCMLGACRKGPNDPALSFRSRDQRLIGDWKMESGEISQVGRFSGNRFENRLNYNGSAVTQTVITNNDPDNAVTSTRPCSLALRMEKDGKAVLTEVMEQGGISRSVTQTGSWAWIDLKKNKSAVQLSNIATSLFENGVYTVDELRHKKLVLKLYRSSETTDTAANFTSRQVSLTFIQ